MLEILRFKFKHYSYFWLTVVCIWIAVFDMNRILPYIGLTMIFVSISIHHRARPRFERFIKQLCHPQTINPHYIETLVNSKLYIREHKYMEIDLLRKKLKSTQSLKQTMSKMKKQYNYAPYVAHKVVNYIEKVKNLLTWYDERKTLVFLAILFLLYIVSLLVPFKLIVYMSRKPSF